jgi:regulator of CtrA degradation
MAEYAHDPRLQRRLVDSFYTEAMVLADEARHYFDEGGRAEREALPPMERVAFSCESLKVTTRLMHVISWLLTQRAIAAGELPENWALDPARRLGAAPTTDVELLARFPAQARGLIWSSVDLHRRVALLDAALTGEVAVVSPARSMLDRLATAF